MVIPKMPEQHLIAQAAPPHQPSNSHPQPGRVVNGFPAVEVVCSQHAPPDLFQLSLFL